MKKLAILFIVLVSLVALAGCNTSKKTVTTFSNDKENTGTTTTVTKLDDKEATTPDPIKISTSSTSSDSGSESQVKFAVTSLTGDTLTTDKGYHLIQGTTPSTTSKITVNGYALSKYKAGETDWSYIAATSLGTLKKGTNYYTVSALDDEGNKIATQNFTIVYSGTDNGSLTSTGSSSLMISIILAVITSLAFLYFRRTSYVKVKSDR